MLKSSDPLYRRIRKHAKQRIQFIPSISKSDRLKGYKEFLRLEREMIIRYHRKGDSGLRVSSAGAILVDVVIESIFRTALLTFSDKFGTLPCMCSLLGLGGYGRGELNPLSDVDIQFLFPDDVRPGVVADMKTVLTDEVLYPLWDLGFKVGHSTRTVKESIEESQLDYKTRNSLLESRLILGSKELHRTLKKTYRSFLDKKDLKPWVMEMIELQEKRREQFGGVVFHPEPNIKNGVGGLRDYQGVLWLLHLMYGNRKLDVLYDHDNLFKKDVRDFEAAYDFMLRVRNELHLNSRRATDELTLGVQPIIAENLGYSGGALLRVEKLMKDYYFHARNNLRIARSLEKRMLSGFAKSVRTRRKLFKLSFMKSPKHEVDGFIVQDDTLYVKEQDIFDLDPRKIIEVFRLMQVMSVKLSVETEQLIEAKIDLLTSKTIRRSAIRRNLQSILNNHGHVFPVLESMYNLGVLGKLLPEFDMLSCYVQHDRHLVRYSEDQKVLGSIEQLDRVARVGSRKGTSILPDLHEESMSDLYWALLLYSIRYPGRFRGITSQKQPKKVNLTRILRRFGIGEERGKRIVTFIDIHRKVAHFWHQAEADDNQMVDRIANGFGNKETVKLSFWFYYFESLGRNPQYWDIHEGEAFANLYNAIIGQLERGANELSEENELISKKEMTRVEIGKRPMPEVSNDEIDAHFHLLPERYFASRNVDDVELHIDLVHQLLVSIQSADSLGSLKPIIDWKDDDCGEYSVINVVTWDRSGLFYKLAGAISSVGLNILKAKAISRSDHIAIDTFYVKHGKTGQVECSEIKQKFENAIDSILVNGEKAIELVREQYDNFNQKGGLYKRSSDFDVTLPVQVDVYYDADLKQVVLDYQGKDRIGLLYRISRVLTKEQLNIDSVRIATNNDIASGTIFLTDELRKQTNDVDRISEIREKLIGILSSEIWLKE